MSITPFHTLACPLDGTPLHRSGSAWRCASGHNFDIASQGYTNLLPVQHKRSRDPGDSKEMVAARRRFLTAGFYQPIAAAVSRAVLADLPVDATINCLDAGCGEGYYLRQLAAAVGDKQTLALLGLDISKWAVLSAAKQDRRPNWVVGSNAKLPVLSGTLDRVLCMFGFPVYAEFARVLKPGGRLLILEFSKPVFPGLKPVYDAYSFSVLPWLGARIANDPDSYRYLAESIRRFPDQETLLGMMRDAGLENCRYHNLSGGIVALHRGYRT